MTIKREFELSEDEVAYIDSKAAEGEGTANDVVRAAIQNAKAHDAVIDRWIQAAVVPTYERWKAGLAKTYTTEEVSSHLRKRRQSRAKNEAS